MTQITQAPREVYMAQLGQDQSAARLAVRQSGEVVGVVQFQVSDGAIAVHLGQVLDLFRDRMDGTRFAQLRGSDAARQFVALETIRSAGVPLDYDAAYDELVLGESSG